MEGSSRDKSETLEAPYKMLAVVDHTLAECDNAGRRRLSGTIFVIYTALYVLLLVGDFHFSLLSSTRSRR